MRKVLRAVVAGFVLSVSFISATQAADSPSVAGTATFKIGDKVYICGCGKECDCNTIQRAPGKCHCGMALITATVVKVDGDRVTVKSANGEQVIKVTKA